MDELKELTAQADNMMDITHPRHDPQAYCLALVAKALTELLRKDFHVHGLNEHTRELKILNRNISELTNEIRYVRGRM